MNLNMVLLFFRWRSDTVTAAACSRTPDWREKVAWLTARAQAGARLQSV